MSRDDATPPPDRLVPQGVLVFFPSMAALSGAAEQWGKRGSDGGPTVLERLEKHKRVIIEPRGQAEVAPALEQQEEYVAPGMIAPAHAPWAPS